jgi:hypothetical protein
LVDVVERVSVEVTEDGARKSVDPVAVGLEIGGNYLAIPFDSFYGFDENGQVLFLDEYAVAIGMFPDGSVKVNPVYLDADGDFERDCDRSSFFVKPGPSWAYTLARAVEVPRLGRCWFRLRGESE